MLLLSSTAIKRVEVVLHEVSRETDTVFLHLSCNSKSVICLSLRLLAVPHQGIAMITCYTSVIQMQHYSGDKFSCMEQATS